MLICVNATSDHLTNAVRIRQTVYYRYSRLGHFDVDEALDEQMDKSPEGAYHSVDTSTIHRVIVDPATKEEIVVHGRDNTTFRDAVRKYWGFSQIDRGSNWIITDERGNDISDSSLSLFDGIAKIRIVGDLPVDTPESSEADYSSLDSSVEYYD